MSTRRLGEPDAQKIPLSDNFQHASRTIVSAYSLCRRMERDILMNLESPSYTDATEASLNTQLIYVRLLGTLWAGSVINALDDEELFQVGKWYLEHFVCTCESAIPLQSPIDDWLLNPYPTNRQEAEHSALVRDNFRCVVSGVLQCEAVHHNKELFQEGLDRSLRADITDCCYIIPEPRSKLKHASSAWAVLGSFGYGQILKDLEGNKIHSLKNVLTMATYLRNMFGALTLWFEATNVPNRYKVCTTRPLVFAVNNIPRFVEFKSTSPKTLELPPSTCCRVAHMSGAVEYLDMLDNLEDDED
ncbi:hypothetical protein BD779DRAFT_1558588 [Infundibulicybe gibba]|nr:hypothetical protein BD779DRAFT_1558588 [Infundibulicybe gibba]